MSSTRSQGSKGEARAAEHLRGLGYTIVTRNIHSRRGEIDIVAMDGDVLVFVEVKQRSRQTAEEAIGPGKAGRLRETARDYLMSVGEPERTYRFDLVAIDENGLRHHRGVLQSE